MIFAPHILQAKHIVPAENDEFGRPIPGTGGEEWKYVCACRCDDNTTKEFQSENGTVYRPAYHVVCGSKTNLEAGDYVRCINPIDNTVRGEGKIYTSKSTNYFSYSELWI